MKSLTLLAIALFTYGCSSQVKEKSPPIAVGTNEMTFNSKDGTVLKGVFSAPINVKGDYPAVMLIPGSGPTDRDGNQPPTITTDLLKTLSKELNTAGFATFRFDKRAAAVYSKNWPKEPSAWSKYFGWQHHLDDIEAAYTTMQSMSGVNKDRCALFGHSEGGMFSVAMANTLHAKVVVLAGTPGRAMQEVLISQIAASLKAQNMTAEQAQHYLDLVNQYNASIIKQGKLPQNIDPGLQSLYGPSVADLLQAELPYNPAVEIKKLKQPVLIINGSWDQQISATIDATKLYQAALGRPNTKSEIYLAHQASHNLKKITTKEEIGLAGEVEPGVIKTLIRFLKANL